MAMLDDYRKALQLRLASLVQQLTTLEVRERVSMDRDTMGNARAEGERGMPRSDYLVVFGDI